MINQWRRAASQGLSVHALGEEIELAQRLWGKYPHEFDAMLDALSESLEAPELIVFEETVSAELARWEESRQAVQRRQARAAGSTGFVNANSDLMQYAAFLLIELNKQPRSQDNTRIYTLFIRELEKMVALPNNEWLTEVCLVGHLLQKETPPKSVVRWSLNRFSFLVEGPTQRNFIVGCCARFFSLYSSDYHRIRRDLESAA